MEDAYRHARGRTSTHLLGEDPESATHDDDGSYYHIDDEVAVDDVIFDVSRWRFHDLPVDGFDAEAGNIRSQSTRLPATTPTV